MAKFYGVIGFATTVETEPGIWEERITERSYSGDLIRNFWNRQPSDSVNDNINISAEISIIADPFAEQNFHSIIYVSLMGTKWKVKDVDPAYPRLNLTIGGVYNGK